MNYLNQLLTVDTIGVTITTLSFVFAIWWYAQSRRIKKLIAFEAIELHKNISIALGATQAAKTQIEAGQSPINEIGRAEGLCQAVLFESTKLYCNLKGTKIDDLIANGQLDERYKNIYYSFSDNKRGYFRMFTKRFQKIF
jgi:hypothetical protein